MPIEAHFEEPVDPVGEIFAFPLPQLARARCIQIVVVALEAVFAAGRDDEIVARVRPKNVVTQVHVLGAVENADGVSRGLIHGVVG